MMNGVLRWLFPPRCALCGAFLQKSEEEICGQCQKSIRLLPFGSQKPLSFAGKPVSALDYRGTVRKAIHRFKFGGRKGYAVPFSRMMAFVWKSAGKTADIVTFVPSNPRTVRKRGYNQAELLALELGEHLKLPVRETLRKTRATKPMFGLTPAQRRANILGALAVCCRPEVLSGKRVLLVDDVLTTGATLSECARMLKEAGALEICCLTAASAQK